MTKMQSDRASQKAGAYVDGVNAARDELKQLCKDFSDMQNRPYMGDVHAQIDAICDRLVAECDEPGLLHDVTSISMKTGYVDERMVVLRVSTTEEMNRLAAGLTSMMRLTPDENGWIKWIGGARPPGVDGAQVEIRMRDGKTASYPGHLIGWNHLCCGTDVVAYRLAAAAAVSSLEASGVLDAGKVVRRHDEQNIGGGAS